MTKPDGMAADALRYLDAHLGDFTRELCDLSRIPSVSANGFPKEEVRRSAEAIRFVHPPGYSYFTMLREKLRWSNAVGSKSDD